MTEGRDVPGDDEAPAADLTDGAERPTDATSPPDEPSSEPPTIGWATGVQWEPAVPEAQALLPPAGVKLGIGSVLGRTLDTFIRRWTLFVVLAIPSVVVAAGSSIILRGSTTSSVGVSVLVTLVGLAIDTVFSLSMIVAADHLRAGREPSYDSVIGRATSRAVAAILSTVAQILALVGVLIVPAVLLGVVIAVGRGGGGAASGGAAIAILLLIAAVIVIAVVAIRWVLSQAAIVLDGFGPIKGLNRSWSVTRGNAWRLFGLYLLLGLLFLPLSIGLSILSLVSLSPLVFVLLAVSSLIGGPLTAIALSTVYGDLTGRPAIEPAPAAIGRGRGILVAAILAVGVVALVIGIPNIGPGLSQLGLSQVPIESRGKILVGTTRDPLDPCRPAGVQSTFSTTDTLYVGGYFTKVIPPGASATVYFYINGTLSDTTPLSSATQSVGCYYETDPVTGVPPATYRLVVEYGGETIGEGTFTVR